MSRITAPAAELPKYIGHEFEPSAWTAVTQERIDAFADCTDDHQFIHVDPVRAAQSPFGGTVAHGFLSLSLLAPLCVDSVIAPAGATICLNYGFNRVRFLGPVRSGKRVRARVKVLDVGNKEAGQLLVTYGVSVEIEGEAKPALACEWLLLWVG